MQDQFYPCSSCVLIGNVSIFSHYVHDLIKRHNFTIKSLSPNLPIDFFISGFSITIVLLLNKLYFLEGVHD